MKSLCILLMVALMSPLVAWAEDTASAVIRPAESKSPAPGTTIDARNAEQYARFIPAAAMFAIKHGFKIDAVPTTRIDWPDGYKQATERYSQQVRLDADDVIQNYVAGAAFPGVGAGDAKAAVKISYNWRWGPFVFDDYTLSNPRIAYYEVDPEKPLVLTHREVNDWSAAKCALLRYAHRTAIDPRPAIEPNPESAELKMMCDQLSDLRYEDNNSAVHVRFLDPAKPDDNFYHSRTSRRLRRSVSSSDGEFWGWQSAFLGLPKTELYRWRLIGTATMLGCMNSAHDPAGIVPDSQPAKLLEEPFQLRNVWVVESTPRDPSWKDSRTIAYIDMETYLELGDEFFQGQEQTAASTMFWRETRGQGVFYLAGEIQHVSAGRTYLAGAFSGTGSDAFYFYLLGAGDQKVNTGDVPEDIFNPNTLQ